MIASYLDHVGVAFVSSLVNTVDLTGDHKGCRDERKTKEREGRGKGGRRGC